MRSPRKSRQSLERRGHEAIVIDFQGVPRPDKLDASNLTQMARSYLQARRGLIESGTDVLC